jgi:hypothetical protein
MNRKNSASRTRNGSNAVELNNFGQHAEDRCIFSSHDDKILIITETPENKEESCLGLISVCNHYNATNIAKNNTGKAQMEGNVTNKDDPVDSIHRETTLAERSLPTPLGYGVSSHELTEKSTPSCLERVEKECLPRTQDFKVDGQENSTGFSRERFGSMSSDNMIDCSIAPESNQSNVASSVPGTEGRRKANSKKATQRMRPKSHAFLKTAQGDKPFLDLRHILKKHQKKSDIHQSCKQSEFQVDFYGSLSSIPFLHPDREKKKPSKGERSQMKRATSYVTRISEPMVLGKSYENSKIIVDREDATTNTFETNFAYDDDVKLWKSMSIQDCNFMQELSRRPNDILPLRNDQSPKTKSKTTSIIHKDHVCSRPEGSSEFSHLFPGDGRFSSRECRQPFVPADPLVLDPKRMPAETNPKKGKARDQTCAEPEGVSLCRGDVLQVHKPFSDVPTVQSKLNPKQCESTDAWQTDARERTTLAIKFPDGCNVSGKFHPNERVQRVIDDLQQDVLRGDMALPSIELYINHRQDEEETLIHPRAKLTELGLVPSGVVFVRWKSPVAVTTSPGWYLRTRK